MLSVHPGAGSQGVGASSVAGWGEEPWAWGGGTPMAASDLGEGGFPWQPPCTQSAGPWDPAAQLHSSGATPAPARGAWPRARSAVTRLCLETGSNQGPRGLLAYLYSVQVFKYLLLAFIGVTARFIFNRVYIYGFQWLHIFCMCKIKLIKQCLS